jgi:hypothetical protein
MPQDPFGDDRGDYGAPARGGEEVTPADGSDLTYVSRALYVGAAGDVTAVMRDGQELTFEAVPGGTLLPIAVTRVKATGTTATGIVAIY